MDWWPGMYLSFHPMPPGESSRLLDGEAVKTLDGCVVWAEVLCGLESLSRCWLNEIFARCLNNFRISVKSETSVFVFFKVVEAFGKILFSKCLCCVTIFGLFVVQKKRTEFWSNLTQSSFQILFLAFIKIKKTELRNWRMGVSCKAALLKCHNLSNSAKF